MKRLSHSFSCKPRSQVSRYVQAASLTNAHSSAHASGISLEIADTMTATQKLESSRWTPPRVERFETVVIGGGQSGLAVGYHLMRRDVDFVILSDEARVGDNWRKRWDSLRLFTPARYSGLPGLPFPATPTHLADKDEVADYLERYAERLDLPVRLGPRACKLTWNGERYVVCIDGCTAVIEADSVVVATGAFQRPRIPTIATRLSAAIHQLHSSQYRNPFALPDGPVLVVGAGNSGAQIALELARFRKVWLAGRDTGHVPRRVIGRDVFDWAWPIIRYATTETRLGRRLRERVRSGGDALIGIPERELRNAGITRVGRLDDERAGLPVCGTEVLEPSVIVWCTGFGPEYSWVDIPGAIAANGYPVHERGVSLASEGLFFAGLRFQHRLSSALIGGVGDDAAFVAERVADRSEARVPVTDGV
jgi:putative flavoprotein involved in K+ transport